MKLVKLLANLGYGSRKQVTQMLRNGWVMRTDGSTLGPDDSVEPADIVVDDEPLDPPPSMVLMLHKPIGVTCSTRDAGGVIYRSEGRRVGKECVSTGRSRWSP